MKTGRQERRRRWKTDRKRRQCGQDHVDIACMHRYNNKVPQKKYMSSRNCRSCHAKAASITYYFRPRPTAGNAMQCHTALNATLATLQEHVAELCICRVRTFCVNELKEVAKEEKAARCRTEKIRAPHNFRQKQFGAQCQPRLHWPWGSATQWPPSIFVPPPKRHPNCPCHPRVTQSLAAPDKQVGQKTSNAWTVGLFSCHSVLLTD